MQRLFVRLPMARWPHRRLGRLADGNTVQRAAALGLDAWAMPKTTTPIPFSPRWATYCLPVYADKM
jgi:hypothetical protein